MNQQQVEMAIGAGMELLGDKSELVIPVKLNDGVFLLKQLLHLIATGQLALSPTMQESKPGPAPEGQETPQGPVVQPGTPSREKRAAARKNRKPK